MTTETAIVITAQTGQAEAGMRGLAGSVEGVSGKLLGMKNLAGSLAGVLSIGAFAGFVRSTVNGIDALNDMADATGASIENLSALELMAGRTGTSFDTVGAALVKFNQTLQAATPGSAAEQSLKQIGLSVAELKRLDPAEALRQTAVALSGYADDGDKARLVQELFGKSVREVAPLLKDLAEQGKLVGPVTQAMAAEADQFNKNLAVLETNLKNGTRALVADLLPAINAASGGLGEFNKTGEQTSIISDAIAVALETVIVLGAEIGYLFKTTGREIGGIIAQFSAMGEGGGIFSAEGRRAWTVVGEEMKRDAETARKEHDQFVERVMTARQRARESSASGGTPAAGGDDRPTVGPGVDPAKAKAAAEAARKELDELLKDWKGFNDAIDPLAAERALSSVGGARVQKAYEEEQRITQAAIDGFNRRNQVLAEQVAQQDLTEEERILYKRDQEFMRLEEEKRIIEEHGKWTMDTEARYAQARLNAQAVADKSVIEMEKKKELARQQVLVSSLGMVSSLMSNKNVALFRMGQAAAIANTVISTQEGAMKAIGQLGIFGWPAAIAIGVAGAASVANIAGTSIGGGTASPVNATFSGGSVQTGMDVPRVTDTATAPNAGVAAARQQIYFHFTGTHISMDQMVNEFIPKLEEAYSNGAGGGAVFNVTRD